MLKNNSIFSILKEATSKLKKKYPYSAKVDAISLLSNILKVDSSYIYINDNLELSSEQISSLDNDIARYINEEPLAYILGYKYFWEQKILVNKNVLIPRADTETIITEIINTYNKDSTLNILDLGTGSGAIAIALASEFQNSQVTGVDISKQAIEIANQNAQINNVKNINFIQSDWYSELVETSFDIIVSNPPYIEKSDKEIDTSVLNNEPHNALFADKNGLSDIIQITNKSSAYLKPNSRIYIEHGYKQSSSVQEIFKQNNFVNIKTIKDLNGLDRVTTALKK